jgi:hypothetical protein
MVRDGDGWLFVVSMDTTLGVANLNDGKAHGCRIDEELDTVLESCSTSALSEMHGRVQLAVLPVCRNLQESV